jgi:LDH2 family malate/lactate/ureidoglycolate dehydrogenase
MGLGALSNVIEILSAALSGGTGGAYRQVILTHDTDKLILPVTPATYKVSTA